MSSLELASSERVCYVHCNFCNTILAVSVPSSSLYTIVTVRCGHCSNLLSVNMGAASLQTVLPHQDHHSQQAQKLQLISEDSSSSGAKFDKDCKDSSSSGSGTGSSKATNKVVVVPTISFDSVDLVEPPRMPPIRPPEKRQRVPSAYNRFIKEEIQRIKASNPDITHREAFSTAAKNWAHFPHIHFGLKLDGNKHAKLDHESFPGEGTSKKKCSATGLMMYDMASI